MSKSPFLLAKQLEQDVLRLLSHIDIVDLDTAEQHRLMQLKNGLIDSRLEIQDYELAETRDNQLRNAKHARQYLQNVEKLITTDSSGLFGAVDVAHLTAKISEIYDRLR